MLHFRFSPRVALGWLIGGVVVLGGWNAAHCAPRDGDERTGGAADAQRANDGPRATTGWESLGTGFTPPGDRCERLTPVNSSRMLNKLAVAAIPRPAPWPRRLPTWLPHGVAGRPAFATPSLQVLFCSWLA